MAPLIHLIYASATTGAASDATLAEILAQSRRNNPRVGLTGMLLYTQGSFFQVLEGAPADVDAVFTTISADPRHTRVVTIVRERIAQRAFGEWSMGYVTATPQEIAEATGRNDFFTQGSCVDLLDGGRVKKLLAAFREGRWRTRIGGAPGESPRPAGAARRQLVHA